MDVWESLITGSRQVSVGCDCQFGVLRRPQAELSGVSPAPVGVNARPGISTVLYRFAPPDKVRPVVALLATALSDTCPRRRLRRSLPAFVGLLGSEVGRRRRYEGPVCGESSQCGNRVATAFGQAGGSTSLQLRMREICAALRFSTRLRRGRLSCKCESLRSYRQVGARGPIALMGPTARFWRRSSLKFDTLALRGRCAELRQVFPICSAPCHTPHGRRCQICLPKLHLGRKGTAALTNSGAFAAAGSHGSCHASARHYAAT